MHYSTCPKKQAKTRKYFIIYVGCSKCVNIAQVAEYTKSNMVLCGSCLKASGQISYDLETKTCFPCLIIWISSRPVASHTMEWVFSKEKTPLLFKTPSTADVLIFVKVRSTAFSFLHFCHRVMQFRSNQVIWYKFPPLSLF